MELLELWQVQSANVDAGNHINSLLFIYVILCCIIKRPVFLLAFLLPEMLFNIEWFDGLAGWHINTIEFIIYSYVVSQCDTNKSKLCCVVVAVTALIFAYDSYIYGASTNYGEPETFIYANISSINLCAHILFISSFISIRRIRNKLRNFINGVVDFSRNSAYLCIC